MPAKTAKRAAPAETVGVTKLDSMPPLKRRRHGTWLDTIKVKSWNDLFDGGVYKVVLPELNHQHEAMTDFIRAAQAAFGTRNRRSGSARRLFCERQSDTVVMLQVVDK